MLWGVMLLLVVSGCSSSSFVGQRVGDFRAYYNTFYNAEKAFEEAIRSLDARSEPIDHDTYLSLFPGPDDVTGEEALDRAIDKSADMLREHPNSKWVDDALMLIGKSYFYQGNFAGAEQKFRETIEQESKLGEEARVWLARTLIAAGKYEEAGTYLRAQLDEEGENRANASQLHLLLGELQVQRGQWEEVAEALDQGLKGVRDDELAARAWFLLGQVYETTERYGEAVKAYEAAAHESSDYELAFAAEVGAVRALGQRGDAAEALARLQHMERDDKNVDRRAELALLRGEIYRTQDRPESARETLRILLYGEELDPSPVRERAHYALGLLYRDAFEDYVRAAAHFDTAATASGQAGSNEAGSAAATPVAITDSHELAETFGSLAEAAHRTEELDSLLYLGSLDEEAFEAFVADLREKRARELEAARQAQEERPTQQGFSAGGFDGDRQQLATEEEPEGAGFLFHRDPARIQEARAAFVQRWGSRPRAPNWRRQSAVSGEASPIARIREDTSAEAADEEQLALSEEPSVGGAEALVDVSAVPRDSASRAAMRAERARARYELANALFLTASRPDSAAVLYRKVIEEGADEEAAAQARYALGEVAQASGDTAVARQHYRQLVEEHPTSELALRAQTRLKGGSEGIAIREAPAQAETEYAEAYEQWQHGRHAEALQAMLATAARYSRTEVAPRALLAAGTLSLEWTRRDTMALHEPLPVDVPDSLFQEGGLLAPASELPVDTAVAEGAPSDTTAAVGTSSPADSLAGSGSVGDSLEADYFSSNSLAEGSFSTDGLTADSLAEGSFSTGSLALSPRVETLFASITAHYPESPQADRARRILEALERPSQAADTFASFSGQVTVPDTSALPSLAGDVEDSLFGGGDLVHTEHSWTIAVGTEEEQAAAEALAGDFRAAGYRAGVLSEAESDTLRYHIGVGQFAEEEEAKAALEALSEALSPPGRLHRIAPSEPSNSALYGSEAIDPGASGWTIIIASEETEHEAEEAAEPYREAGYRVGIFPVQLEGEMRYRVGVGQFTTQEEAEAGRDMLDAMLPSDSWLLQMPL